MELSKRITKKGAAAHNDREILIRIAGFIFFAVMPVAIAWNSIRPLRVLVMDSDTYSHLPLIPLFSLFFIFAERKNIFSHVSSGFKAGSVLALAGGTIFVLGLLDHSMMSSELSLPLLMLGLVSLWAGIFALFFGSQAFQGAMFPLLFLLFMVPIPQPFLKVLIFSLQKGSAQVAAILFKLLGVPVFQQGFDFALPGVTIRVAEECSGIRSSLALLITAVVANHVYLRTTWGGIISCLFIFPIALIKNGLRIVTLSAFAVYVDPSFLYGSLHHRGGVLFFLLGLLMLAFVLTLIRRSELRIELLGVSKAPANSRVEGTPSPPVTSYETGPKI